MFYFNLIPTVLALVSISFVSCVNIPEPVPPGDSVRPLYAVAHRVLGAKGIKAAISHGANAIEIDACAWSEKWWADHDCGTFLSRENTMETMFQTIAQLRQENETISFVYLDLKNPDYCAHAPCNIETLQRMARAYLQPHGVRVLYAFAKPRKGSRSWKHITDSLNSNEAITVYEGLWGHASDVLDVYRRIGQNIPIPQRAMDDGLAALFVNFGDCQTRGICNQLRLGSKARDNGQLGKVFGWTTTENEYQYVDKLFGVAKVDGILYGPRASMYKNTTSNRSAANDILEWVRTHSATHRLATQDDKPW